MNNKQSTQKCSHPTRNHLLLRIVKSRRKKTQLKLIKKMNLPMTMMLHHLKKNQKKKNLIKINTFRCWQKCFHQNI